MAVIIAAIKYNRLSAVWLLRLDILLDGFRELKRCLHQVIEFVNLIE